MMKRDFEFRELEDCIRGTENPWPNVNESVENGFFVFVSTQSSFV